VCLLKKHTRPSGLVVVRPSGGGHCACAEHNVGQHLQHFLGFAGRGSGNLEKRSRRKKQVAGSLLVADEGCECKVVQRLSRLYQRLSRLYVAHGEAELVCDSRHFGCWPTGSEPVYATWLMGRRGAAATRA
jgi:hypothetical protein